MNDKGDKIAAAVMQPYFFPYLGYFQLLAASSVFVFYEDVAFIKRGWIHRNRILLNGQSHLLTIPVQNSSQNVLICDTLIVEDRRAIASHLKTIKQAYHHAPFFKTIFPMIEESFADSANKTIANFAIESIESVCKYLELNRKFERSAKYGNQGLGRAERLIDITKKEGCSRYINPIGGKVLYDRREFQREGVELLFHSMNNVGYNQFCEPFVENLSIIDVLMFNSKDNVRLLLNEYTLE